MPKHIAFLRAVNVGKRKYPMAELRQALADAGFEDVQTHIQTGNVLVTSSMRSGPKVGSALERVFEADRGFFVDTIVFSPQELGQVGADIDDLDAADPPKFAHYVSLLKERPSTEQARLMEGLATDRERVTVRGRAVHLLYDIPYHEARTSNATVEKTIGVATNRNATVVRKLVEKWCS